MKETSLFEDCASLFDFVFFVLFSLAISLFILEWSEVLKGVAKPKRFDSNPEKVSIKPEKVDQKL